MNCICNEFKYCREDLKVLGLAKSECRCLMTAHMRAYICTLCVTRVLVEYCLLL
jgi:hypothetical protein